MPVALGGFSTRLGVNETNLVPRRRSSRIMGGWADGRSGGKRGSWLATAGPAALEAYDTPGLVRGFGAAVRTGRSLGRGFPGFAHRHTPRIYPEDRAQQLRLR